jgi:hypothetical protein
MKYLAGYRPLARDIEPGSGGLPDGSRVRLVFHARLCVHQALDALNVGIEEKRVNWILDADIRGFFDI